MHISVVVGVSAWYSFRDSLESFRQRWGDFEVRLLSERGRSGERAADDSDNFQITVFGKNVLWITIYSERGTIILILYRCECGIGGT